MPTTPIEIPREGDLKDAPPAARDELIALRNTIHDTEGSTDDSRKMIDAAISSGSRGEVVRALQALQTRTEFGRLRDRIEANRIGVSNNNVGLMDQTIVRGEQGARYAYNNLMPNWLKLGAITGGATWLASRVATYTVGLFMGKEGRDKLRDWGNKAALGIGGVAAATKLVTDVATSRTTLTSTAIREIPGGPLLFSTAAPTLDLSQREKRIGDVLRRTEWQRPLTNNRFVLPPINTTDLPIELMRLTQLRADGSVAGSTEFTPTSATVPIASAAERPFTAEDGVTKITIQFRMAGSPDLRPTPPITIDKPTV